jgi:uncharacterized protein YbjT (DUF2867 family)
MSNPKQTHIVTGAFGFTGKYIANRLLQAGHSVRTLTHHPGKPDPFGNRVTVHRYDFHDPNKLKQAFEGAAVFYNTYWVRFNHPRFTHAAAIRNSMAMFEAARRAGVQRIVHISITNPSLDTELEYFRGKAILEQSVRESGIPYAILRPAVLFGPEDILINNIAWALRRFPLFGIFGDGNYGIQPIHADDLAALAVEQGLRRDNSIIDAIGPETFTYKELVAAIGRAIGKNRPMVSMAPRLGYLAARLIGRMVGDVFLTWEEIEGLMAGKLAVNSPPAGSTRLTAWMAAHSDTLGKHYASELGRRIDRK